MEIDLKELKETLEDSAIKMFKQQKEVTPHSLVLTTKEALKKATGEKNMEDPLEDLDSKLSILYFPLDFHPDRKQLTIIKLKAMCRMLDAIAVLLVTESWMVSRPPGTPIDNNIKVSEEPDRKEALVLTFESIGYHNTRVLLVEQKEPEVVLVEQGELKQVQSAFKGFIVSHM